MAYCWNEQLVAAEADISMLNGATPQPCCAGRLSQQASIGSSATASAADVSYPH